MYTIRFLCCKCTQFIPIHSRCTYTCNRTYQEYALNAYVPDIYEYVCRTRCTCSLNVHTAAYFR